MYRPAMRIVDDRGEHVWLPELHTDRDRFILWRDHCISFDCNHSVFPVGTDAVILFSPSDIAGSDKRKRGNYQTLSVS